MCPLPIVTPADLADSKIIVMLINIPWDPTFNLLLLDPDQRSITHVASGEGFATLDSGISYYLCDLVPKVLALQEYRTVPKSFGEIAIAGDHVPS
jgi:hypothetical protein